MEKVVGVLNIEIADKVEAMDNHILSFTYMTTGYSYDAVLFGDVVLWDSENHEIEEGESKESHIRRKYNEYVANLAEIRFVLGEITRVEFEGDEVLSKGDRTVLQKVYDKAFTFAIVVDGINLAEVRETVFSHMFAKAFWGDKPTQWFECDDGSIRTKPAWKYHLQQMVLEENPVEYLRKFI